MPRIQVPRISQALRERFGIRGPGSIETLAPELVGVVLADDIRAKVEIPVCGWVTATGAGGHRPCLSIRNQGNRVLRIDTCIIGSATDGALQCLAGTPPGTVGYIDTKMRDLRFITGETPEIQLGASNDASTNPGDRLLIVRYVALSAAGSIPIPMGMFLGEDDEVYWRHPTANTDLYVTWYGAILNPVLEPLPSA